MAQFSLLATEEHFRMIAHAAACSDAPAVETPKPIREKTLDKALAYLSYCALVFTALCVFLPTPTAKALTIIKYSTLSPFMGHARTTVSHNPNMQWKIRREKF